MIRLAILLIFSSVMFGCNSDTNSQNQPKTDADSQTLADKSSDQPKANSPQESLVITWQDLKDVKFEEKFYEKEKEWMLFPSFGNAVQILEGKTVEITGYVIPLEPKRYALSANPFSACFFCGNAGPESVMELELVSYDQMYYTDEFRTFRGKFALNITNLDKMNYVLTAAEPVD